MGNELNKASHVEMHRGRFRRLRQIDAEAVNKIDCILRKGGSGADPRRFIMQESCWT
jgi:hypothetical protein